MTSAEHRAATRDKWATGSLHTRAATALEWTLGGLLATALMLAGSLNI